MPYVTVLNLIDADIERLLAARRVLCDDSQQSPAAVAAGEAEEAEPLEILDAPAASEPVPVRRVAGRRLQGVTRRRARARQVSEPGALSGTVPAAPVAVSAADAVRSRQAIVREQEAKAAAVDAPAPAEGTLEALLKDLRGRSTAA